MVNKTADIKEYKRAYREANSSPAYRNGKLNPKTEVGKGFIAEVVVAKALNLESGARCNCVTSFGYKYDLLDPGEYGEINVKSSKLLERPRGKGWIWGFSLANKYKPDTYIFVAYTKDNKDITHVWIVPADAAVVNGVTSLTISNSDKGLSRIQEHEVDNTMYNVYLHTMSIDRCSVLQKPDFITEMLE